MPAAPTAPAPTAPKSTPTAPAKPAPTAPTKATKPEIAAPVESNDPFQDAFADIDSMDSGKPKVQPKREVQKPEQKSDELDDKAGVVEEVEDEVQKTEAEKPKEDGKPSGKFVKAKPLREAYDALIEKEKSEYVPKLKRLTELEAKVKEYETKNPEAEKAVQDRVASIEKRNAELESHIKFVDYQKSSEYQEKYWQPYVQAWENATRELKGLTLTIEDAKGGDPITREVTQADLQYFANLDAAARRTEINRLFPEDKEEVKRHINQISHLFEQSQKALEKAKADAETHATTQKQQQAEFQKNREKFWRQANEFYAKKYPQWFDKSEEDEEGNKIFDRGVALADLTFFPQDLNEEKISLLPKSIQEAIAAKKPFTPEQLTKLHSIIRNKAANHDRLAYQNKGLKARIAELEKSLKDYEDSGPDNVKAAVVNGMPSGEASYEAELDALDRKGR